MYFCVAAPAANSVSFFAWASSSSSSASGPSRLFSAGAGHHLVHQLLDCGHQGELAGHRGLHQPASDDEAVDLVGALKDAVDAGVAVGALGGILLDVAVAGEDLQHLVDDHVEHLAEPRL